MKSRVPRGIALIGVIACESAEGADCFRCAEEDPTLPSKRIVSSVHQWSLWLMDPWDIWDSWIPQGFVCPPVQNLTQKIEVDIDVQTNKKPLNIFCRSVQTAKKP